MNTFMNTFFFLLFIIVYLPETQLDCAELILQHFIELCCQYVWISVRLQDLVVGFVFYYTGIYYFVSV